MEFAVFAFYAADETQEALELRLEGPCVVDVGLEALNEVLEGLQAEEETLGAVLEALGDKGRVG